MSIHRSATIDKPHLAAVLAAAAIAALSLTVAPQRADAVPANPSACATVTPTKSGTAGANTIYGTAGADIIVGQAGNDKLYGGQGPDRMCGDDGDDQVYGSDGDDQLVGGSGKDIVNGGQGSDGLVGGDGSDNLDGGLANDDILGGSGDDKLNGGDGDDQLSSETGNDIVNGGQGSDGLVGGDGADILDGGLANDDILGEAGNDKLVGAAGNDTISGGDGEDAIDGGDGNDTLSGGDGTDRIYAGPGNDTIDAFDGSADIIKCGPGYDKVIRRDAIDQRSSDCEYNAPDEWWKPASLALDPDPPFDDVNYQAGLGQTAMETFTVTNTGHGEAPLGVTFRARVSSRFIDLSQFQISDNGCPEVLDGKTSCSFKVAYKPTKLGPVAAVVVAYRSDLFSPTDSFETEPRPPSGQYVYVTETVVGYTDGVLDIKPGCTIFSASCQSADLSQPRRFTVTNPTESAVDVALGVSADRRPHPTWLSQPDSFVLSRDTCTGVLQAGASCTFWAVYQPTSGNGAYATVYAITGDGWTTQAMVHGVAS